MNFKDLTTDIQIVATLFKEDEGLTSERIAQMRTEWREWAEHERLKEEFQRLEMIDREYGNEAFQNHD